MMDVWYLYKRIVLLSRHFPSEFKCELYNCDIVRKESITTNKEIIFVTFCPGYSSYSLADTDYPAN